MTGKTEEMIQSIPRGEQVVVRRLCALIEECIPAATEKAYYDMGIVYSHHRMICFVWPPSVFWGEKEKRDVKIQKEKGVTLGFCQGNRMANDDGLLLSEGRKQIFVMYIKNLSEIREDVVRALLFEAAMVDEEFGRTKRRRKKK
jgi:hypothetical protein